jgi:gas vesicle protein
MNNTGKILTALGIGIAAGAVLGILFAPDKGSETRKKIADKGRKLSEAVKEKIAEGKDKLNGLKKEVEEVI